MLKKSYLLIIMLFVTFVFVGCSNNREVSTKIEDNSKNLKGTLNLSAAASLKISLEKINLEFKKVYPDVEIKLNTNGSDKLFKQMKEGAPTDIFISASTKWMNEAVNAGIILENDQKPLLNNEVVLIKHKNAKSIKLSDFEDGKDLCLGAESVPVGGYSKKYFESTKQWDSIKNDASFEQQVTDVVKKVAEGARSYGLVYRTDANSEIKNGTIEIIDKIPDDAGIKVIYPIGITKSVNDKKLAEIYVEFLKKGVAKDILEDVGFVFVE